MTRKAQRLGMLVPSSNTVLEPETAKLVPMDGSVTTHVARIDVVQISGDADSLGQFTTEPFLKAADQLAAAKVDLILWNGTAASWLGFDWDRRIVDAIQTRTGIAATTAIMAIDAELTRLGARRIGLVTPYVAALETRIITNYEALGIAVTAAERMDLTINTDFAEVSPETIGAMARKTAASRPDAIVVLCTNLAGSPIVESMSRELGIPIVDSVRIAVQHSLALLAAHP